MFPVYFQIRYLNDYLHVRRANVDGGVYLVSTGVRT